MPPKYYLKNEIHVVRVFSWYFRGIFRSSAVGEFGYRGGILDLFWGLGAFLLCSWVVGCQQ